MVSKRANNMYYAFVESASKYVGMTDLSKHSAFCTNIDFSFQLCPKYKQEWFNTRLIILRTQLDLSQYYSASMYVLIP